MLRWEKNKDWEVAAMLMYLDPGTGSMLLQALAGGIAGLAVVGKLYWARIKRALRLGRRDPAPQDHAS
jgi:hypothetical protein